MPPAIPGLGSQGGFSFWLQDRSGGIDREPRRRPCSSSWPRRASGPSSARVNSPFSAAVPQVFVDVDRDKVLKEGIALTDVYQTMQTFLGGLYVNQFNRFGRQWRVFLQAEGAERTSPESIGAVLRAQQRRPDGADVVAADDAPDLRAAVHQPLQRLPRRAGHRRRRARLQLGPGARRARGGGARRRCRAAFSYDWADLSFQERRASGNALRLFALSIVFVFLILAALYESWSLPFSVLLSVPVAVVGAFARPAAAASSTSTSTPRSASSC